MLENLRSSDYPREQWELIVVDDGSTDDSSMLASRNADVVIRLPGPSRGPGYARNRGVETLLIHALSENTAMLKIARNAGATVVREGSESDAALKLPPDTFGSHIDELVEQQAAELDYRLKVRARQVGDILGAIGDVKASLNKSTHVAEE